MKKLILVSILMLTVLFGCSFSDAVAKISNGKEAIVTVGGKSYTKEMFYNTLTYTGDAYSALMNVATKAIIEKNVTKTAEMEETASKTVADLKESLGEKFQDYLSGYGFKDEADYYSVVLQSEMQKSMYKDYVTNNFDAIIVDEKAGKVKVIQCDEEEKCISAIKEIKDGKDFKEVASTYSTTAYKGDEQLIFKPSGIPAVVFTYLSSENPNLSVAPTADATSGTFYVIQIIERDSNKFKDEAIEALYKNTTITSKIMEQMFIDAGFKVYSKDYLDMVNASNSGYLK